jgi:hypothetical protein
MPEPAEPYWRVNRILDWFLHFESADFEKDFSRYAEFAAAGMPWLWFTLGMLSQPFGRCFCHGRLHWMSDDRVCREFVAPLLAAAVRWLTEIARLEPRLLPGLDGWSTSLFHGIALCRGEWWKDFRCRTAAEVVAALLQLGAIRENGQGYELTPGAAGRTA